MDPQHVLESLAKEKGVALTHLAEINRKYSQSSKVACCGGVMTRLVTESAADSAVLLQDSSGSCYCALHGDITSRYSDVLTTGALLLFTDITVLIVSSKVPPMLIACLQNLAGLLLPDKAEGRSAATGPRSASGAGFRCSPERVLSPRGATFSGDFSARSDTRLTNSLISGRQGYDDCSMLGSSKGVECSYAEPRHSIGAGFSSQHAPGGERHGTVPKAKKPRTHDTAASAFLEVDDEDDADCLELVDGM